MHAFDQYVEKKTNNEMIVTLPFDVWFKQLCVVQTQVDCWFFSMAVDLILQLVKSCRTVDLSL